MHRMDLSNHLALLIHLTFFELKEQDAAKLYILSMEERSWFANPSGEYGKKLEWLVMEGLFENKLAKLFQKRSLVLRARSPHASIEANDPNLVYLSDLSNMLDLQEPFKLYNDFGGDILLYCVTKTGAVLFLIQVKLGSRLISKSEDPSTKDCIQHIYDRLLNQHKALEPLFQKFQMLRMTKVQYVLATTRKLSQPAAKFLDICNPGVQIWNATTLKQYIWPKRVLKFAEESTIAWLK